MAQWHHIFCRSDAAPSCDELAECMTDFWYGDGSPDITPTPHGTVWRELIVELPGTPSQRIDLLLDSTPEAVAQLVDELLEGHGEEIPQEVINTLRSSRQGPSPVTVSTTGTSNCKSTSAYPRPEPSGRISRTRSTAALPVRRGQCRMNHLKTSMPGWLVSERFGEIRSEFCEKWQGFYKYEDVYFSPDQAFGRPHLENSFSLLKEMSADESYRHIINRTLRPGRWWLPAFRAPGESVPRWRLRAGCRIFRSFLSPWALCSPRTIRASLWRSVLNDLKASYSVDR